MLNHKTAPFMISLTAIISIVSGCGVVPAGQASTRIFTVTGFTLPVAMVHTGDAAIRAQLSNIANSRGAVQALVNRLVMQTVFDVLESQGRSALLSDAVISSILSQLTINVTYVPLECKKVALMPMRDTRCTSDFTVNYKQGANYSRRQTQSSTIAKAMLVHFKNVEKNCLPPIFIFHHSFLLLDVHKLNICRFFLARDMEKRKGK
ncbi:hypothetical protein KIN20_031841 [Parelaphostrongylus tenuis]|uniref:Lipoprotein n=1 Tax=Parelaphostrongylus tenuis TaxID=148309 RepID=A0AAD5R5Z6_PARTN|nr:hypothetical protein KIN20_031841 [Parelaphostrongylus tenuis]